MKKRVASQLPVLRTRVTELEAQLTAARAELAHARSEHARTEGKMQAAVEDARRLERWIKAQAGLVVLRTDAGGVVALNAADRLARGTSLESALRALMAETEHGGRATSEMAPTIDGGMALREYVPAHYGARAPRFPRLPADGR